MHGAGERDADQVARLLYWIVVLCQCDMTRLLSSEVGSRIKPQITRREYVQRNRQTGRSLLHVELDSFHGIGKRHSLSAAAAPCLYVLIFDPSSLSLVHLVS